MAKKASAKKQSRSTKPASSAKRKNPKRAAPARKRSKKKKSAGDQLANRAAQARRKKSLEAIALYEKALKALQRRDLSTASNLFQRVIDDFPEERELHERSRRYLEVCRRGSAPKPTPQTLEERVYAATLALNAGAPDEALRHLEAALSERPDSDDVQYMLAVANAADGEHSAAVTHLQRAIELNPDNRFLARNEPSFEALQDEVSFQQLVS